MVFIFYPKRVFDSSTEHHFDGQRYGSFGQPGVAVAQTLDHQVYNATAQRNLIVKTIPTCCGSVKTHISLTLNSNDRLFQNDSNLKRKVKLVRLG